jgi:hypothetical protein
MFMRKYSLSNTNFFAFFLPENLVVSSILLEEEKLNIQKIISFLSKKNKENIPYLLKNIKDLRLGGLSYPKRRSFCVQL